MFLERDMDMIQGDGLMVLEFDEETRSFPCKKCGHLKIMTTHPMEMISVSTAEITIKSSTKIIINVFMKCIA